MPPLSDEEITIHSYLDGILQEVEQRFGPRDTSFKILPTEIGGPYPRLYFPGNPGEVVVQLGDKAKGELTEALSQLAHEAVHLLNPGTSASVLEEGLATRFQLEYGNRRSPGYSCPDPDRVTACRLVGDLLSLVPDAVRLLRGSGRSLSMVAPAEILALDPKIKDESAKMLASKFQPPRGHAA